MADSEKKRSANSAENLREFFATINADDGFVVVQRAMMRIVPFCTEFRSLHFGKELTLAYFRAVLVHLLSTNLLSKETAELHLRRVASKAWRPDEPFRSELYFDIVSAANRRRKSDGSPMDGVEAVQLSARVIAVCAQIRGNEAGGIGSDVALSVDYAVGRFWDSIESDCDFLKDYSAAKLIKHSLWDNEPSIAVASYKNFNAQLGEKTPWSLIPHWYQQLRSDATVDPFPNKALDEIANEDSVFWGDGEDDPDYDTIIANIAERLGWKPSGAEIIDSPYDPAFVGYEPVHLDREGPQPIVVRDHTYLHSAALTRLDKLEDLCASDDGGGQAVQGLANLLPYIRSQLGAGPNEFYLKGVVTEHRSLQKLIETQLAVSEMTESQREWEAPLWPVHTRNEAIDASEVIQDLINNDEQAKLLAKAPEDDPISDEDRQVNEEARALLRQLHGNVDEGRVDESVPSTFDRAIAGVDEANRSTKTGEKPGGRPVGHLRGTM